MRAPIGALTMKSWTILLPSLKSKHKASVEAMEAAGDELSFLNRNQVLFDENKMLIQPQRKHFIYLQEILGVRQRGHAKKAPSHPRINQLVESPVLNLLIIPPSSGAQLEPYCILRPTCHIASMPFISLQLR